MNARAKCRMWADRIVTGLGVAMVVAFGFFVHDQAKHDPHSVWFDHDMVHARTN
jgi:hypothetical protein